MSLRVAQPFDTGALDGLLGRSAVPMPRAARWAIAPPDPLLAVHAEPAGRTLLLPSWGFIPPWETDPWQARLKPITAKIETVASSRLFTQAFRRYRVLVPVIAWHEWLAASTELWQPYTFGRSDGGLLTLGGLVSVPRSRRSRAGLSLAIITRPAPAAWPVAQERVPLVIAEADHALWLGETQGTGEIQGALDAIADRPAYDEISFWPMSSDRNQAGAEGAEPPDSRETDPLVAPTPGHD